MRHAPPPSAIVTPPPPPPPTPAAREVRQEDMEEGRKIKVTRRKTKSKCESLESSGWSKIQRSTGELGRAPSWVSLRGLFVSSTSGDRRAYEESKAVAVDARKKKSSSNNKDEKVASSDIGAGEDGAPLVKKKNVSKDRESSSSSSSGRLRCSVSICNSKGTSDVMLQGGLEGTTAAAPATPKSGSGGGGICYRKTTAAAASKTNSGGTTEHDITTPHHRRKNKHKVPLKEINGNTTQPSSATSASTSFSTSSRSGITSRAVVISSSSSSSTASSSSVGGSFRGLPLRRFSVCQECHSVVDPVSRLSRDPSLRSSLCPCPDCGEVFIKPDSLEMHQKTRHAVVELGPEDTSRNIVEIIFQSSWLKKHPATCKIDRILKINNTASTISRFEDYRDAVRSRARKAHHQSVKKSPSATSTPQQSSSSYPRCAADGNELLRFHCATVSCSVGAKGNTSLCDGLPRCGACGIIRDGFRPDAYGKIRTMATSGRAHDTAQLGEHQLTRRAMLVCRVIAGRVMRGAGAITAIQDNPVAAGAGEDYCGGGGSYDSVAGPPGVYSSLDEMFVFNPRAILPCFLVVYRESSAA